jgi:hypothetical protein
MNNDLPHELKGQIFWCIKPSTESETYGDGGPHEPWQGKVVQWYGNSWFYLCAFDADTGEPDRDSNACCQVQIEDMYKTELEAWRAYKVQVAIGIAGLRACLSKAEDKIKSLEETKV